MGQKPKTDTTEAASVTELYPGGLTNIRSPFVGKLDYLGKSLAIGECLNIQLNLSCSVFPKVSGGGV